MTIAQTHVKAKFSFGEDQDDVASWIIPTKAQAVPFSSPACFRHPPARPSLFCITQAEKPNLPTPSCDLLSRPPHPRRPSTHPPNPRLPPLINRREEKRKEKKRTPRALLPCVLLPPALRLIPLSPSSRRPLPLRASHRHPLPSRV